MKITPFNLRSCIFGLTPSEWLHSATLIPFFMDSSFDLLPLSQERNLGVKQGLGVVLLIEVETSLPIREVWNVQITFT